MEISSKTLWDSSWPTAALLLAMPAFVSAVHVPCIPVSTQMTGHLKPVSQHCRVSHSQRPNAAA